MIIYYYYYYYYYYYFQYYQYYYFNYNNNFIIIIIIYFFNLLTQKTQNRLHKQKQITYIWTQARAALHRNYRNRKKSKANITNKEVFSLLQP